MPCRTTEVRPLNPTDLGKLHTLVVGTRAGKTHALKKTLDESPNAVVVVRDDAARAHLIAVGIRPEQIKTFAELKGSAKNVHV